MNMKILVVSFLALGLTVSAYARDVHVNGYYRSNGTYVRPHIRSAPNSSLSDNYGPSTADSQLMNPTTRDYDGDGTPNYLDKDDDNDGKSDDQDSNQYGR